MSTQHSNTALAISLEPLVLASGAVGVVTLVATTAFMGLRTTGGVIAGWACVSSEDIQELNAGLVVVAATDNKGPSSVGAALMKGATDKGSSAVANEALTASTGWCKSCIKKGVASALMDLEEHAEALLVISSGDIPLIVPLYFREDSNGL
ncbi:hypothetical protein E4T56_gene3555 [Termitomyces sp. T112]|nr:hypothetical protein E4T56_gene3555 [Termitomyces sp. T112]